MGSAVLCGLGIRLLSSRPVIPPFTKTLDALSRCVIGIWLMSKLIEDLGGYAAVAKQLSLPANLVWNWQERGVPWRWRPKVASLAKRAKIKVPADFLEPDTAA